jgi:hypothetical protein
MDHTPICAPQQPEKQPLLLSGEFERKSNTDYIRNPFEVIKQQMQIGLGKTTKETAQYIFNAKGIRGNFQLKRS